ncbi:MAG TPA: DivIVA domain-containing protein [Firmicutes bacterium]|nr:DivIVA domain-containing protein [Bacillota bacterium]
MLTANEIRNVTFNRSMGGYKTAEVDEFLDQCADTVAALTTAKAELEKKLEVLADKLVEYRNDEDSIRTALLSAQRLGDTVVREANHKAGLILEDANIKAQKIVDTAQKNIVDAQAEFERIRREITAFKARMLSIYREHLAVIDVLPEEPAEEAPAQEPSPAAPPEAVQAEPAAEPASEPAFEPVEEPNAEAAADSVYSDDAADGAASRGVVLDLPVLQEDDAAVPPEAGQPEPAAAAQPGSRFGDLKFGDDYDISKDTDDEPGFFRRRK